MSVGDADADWVFLKSFDKTRVCFYVFRLDRISRLSIGYMISQFSVFRLDRISRLSVGYMISQFSVFRLEMISRLSVVILTDLSLIQPPTDSYLIPL